jgi:hypothetical protein
VVKLTLGQFIERVETLRVGGSMAFEPPSNFEHLELYLTTKSRRGSSGGTEGKNEGQDRNGNSREDEGKKRFRPSRCGRGDKRSKSLSADSFLGGDGALLTAWKYVIRYVLTAGYNRPDNATVMAETTLRTDRGVPHSVTARALIGGARVLAPGGVKQV